jgi:hypothetical protein
MFEQVAQPDGLKRRAHLVITATLSECLNRLTPS